MEDLYVVLNRVGEIVARKGGAPKAKNTQSVEGLKEFNGLYCRGCGKNNVMALAGWHGNIFLFKAQCADCLEVFYYEKEVTPGISEQYISQHHMQQDLEFKAIHMFNNWDRAVNTISRKLRYEKEGNVYKPLSWDARNKK